MPGICSDGCESNVNIVAIVYNAVERFKDVLRYIHFFSCAFMLWYGFFTLSVILEYGNHSLFFCYVKQTCL